MRGSREAWTIEKPEEGKKEKERLREIEGDEISRFPMRPSCRVAGLVGRPVGNKWQREGGRKELAEEKAACVIWNWNRKGICKGITFQICNFSFQEQVERIPIHDSIDFEESTQLYCVTNLTFAE